jgi:hypothetical protein
MWKLFKLDLYNKLNSAHLSKDKFTNTIFDAMDRSYKRHIDLSTAGGRLVSTPREKVIRTALNVLGKSNRLSTNPKSIDFSDQIGAYVYSYWTLRVIEGPIGTTIVLFPGVYSPILVSPNYTKHGLDFVDSLTTALILHKSTMAGITIRKFPPSVTPWSGTSFKSFDEFTQVGNLVQSLADVLRDNLKEKVNAGYLEPEDLVSIANDFTNNMSQVTTPLVGLANSTPEIGKQSVEETFNRGQ